MNWTKVAVRASALAATIVALTACTTPLEHGDAVAPEQIKADLVGKSWSGTLSDGSSSTWKLATDGTTQIQGGLNDTGHWRMSDKGYCVTWNHMRHGAEGCYTVERAPSGHYVIHRATGELVMTVVKVE
jgi:hypothetical protein